MMTTDLAGARAFVRAHFPEGGKILCAVSGGLDSMCLLHFAAAQPELRVTAAHFNHRLRGETADRDEAFVKRWCEEQGIPCVCGQGDVAYYAKDRGLSVEEAARTLRYAFLQAAAEQGGYDAIFTAHHADDNAETMLLNLVRGTGAAGLTGIPRVRENIYRPFLETERSALEAYASKYDIPHVEDETNQLDDASRNLLRHKVLPVLKEVNPRAVENMARTATLLKDDDDALNRAAKALLEQGGTDPGREAWLAVEACDGQPRAVISRCLWEMMAAVAGHKRDLTHAHVEAALALLWALPGQEVSLPYDMAARRESGTIRVCRRDLPGEMTLEPDRPTRWGGCTLTLLDHREGEGLAIRSGEGTVTVAPCRPGQRMTLPESRGSRSIKRLCIDRRISLAERDRLPAVYVDGKLAAVWRLGVNLEFLPEENACRFIQIMKEIEEN